MDPKKIKFQHLILCLLFLAQWACMSKTDHSSNENPVIHVFAASGARLVSDQICALFEESQGIDVICSYASSGTLARQISQGAEADIFISANRQWIDFLSEGDFLQPGSISKIAENSLVLAASVSQDIEAPEFTRNYPLETIIASRIAIGDPAFVPVGRYALQVLDKLGWNDLLKDKIILAKDVSMALKYAELGECDWAMVYRSEALLSEKVKIICTVPDTLHQPIEFYLSLKKGKNNKANQLAELYRSDTAQFILASAGFLTEKISE